MGIDDEVNPFECGLGWQVNLKKKTDFVGRAALEKIKQEGVTHKLAGLRLGGKPIDWYPADFYTVHMRRNEAKQVDDISDNSVMGYITSAWYSPSQRTNIALAMLPVEYTTEGIEVDVALPDEYLDAPGLRVPAKVCEVPFKKIDSAENRTGMAKGKKG